MTEPERRERAQYTIDELAAKTGTPSRTIRFYQAKGVLPSPRREGRVAYYDDSHVERIEMVGKLQDKGLHLKAIRDLVTRRDVDGAAIQKWLGVGERIGALTDNSPSLVTEEGLKQLLGDPPPGVIGALIRGGLVSVEGEGPSRRYLIRAPALLQIGRRLFDAGVDIETAIGLQDILRRRLTPTAEELVEYAAKRIGRGFGKSAEPDDVLAVVEALFDGTVGGEAVRLIFRQEVERALQHVLSLRGVVRR